MLSDLKRNAPKMAVAAVALALLLMGVFMTQRPAAIAPDPGGGGLAESQ